jgi:flavorubredoxin
MPRIDEIAPNVFRISIYAEALDLQFNHFVVRDEEPLLYHTGMRQMFPELKESVAKILDPGGLRWIGWSHFEVDECGALNQWLATAPKALPVCGFVGAMVNITDFSDRPPKALAPEDRLETGEHRFRFIPTPHLPHGWDAGALFEENGRTLFCSDLLHQIGDREALLEKGDLLERTREAISGYQSGPLMDYMPYTKNTSRLLNELALLEPKTLAIMHGSSYSGEGAKVLRGLDPVYREVFGKGEVR